MIRSMFLHALLLVTTGTITGTAWAQTVIPNPYPPTTHGHHPPTQPTVFGGFTQAEYWARRLETTTNELCLDLHYNYQHNPDFMTIYRESYNLLLMAKGLHHDIHRHNRDAVVSKLAGLDQEFHHIEDDLEPWTSSQKYLVGQGDTKYKIEQVEQAIHKLLYEAGVNPTPVGQPGPTNGVAPPPK